MDGNFFYGLVWAGLMGFFGLEARGQQGDPYEDYVRHSEEFASVKQDKAWAGKACPSWTFMPWT
jgi:hypothetical protein